MRQPNSEDIMFRPRSTFSILLITVLGFATGCQVDNHVAQLDPPDKPWPASGRHALLVGVAGYDRGKPHTRDWWNIHTEADVEAVRSVLLDRCGFQSSDIRVLKTKEQTTGDAILKAFRRLIKDTHPGDIVYFHYSGHGDQAPELKPGEHLDHLDACLVPSDYASLNDGSRNIHDATIDELLTALHAQNPGNVTLVFDCCHAGTITKGGRHTVRGRAYTGPLPATQANTQPTTQPVQRVRMGPSGLFVAGAAERLGYVAICACRSNELAQETDSKGDGEDDTGFLTFALVQAIREVRPITSGSAATTRADVPRTTYRNLFERVTDVITRKHQNQTPVLEGQIDRELLGGAVLPPKPYTLIAVTDHNALRLQGGKLQGVTAGSVYAVYPPDTTDFDHVTPIAAASVNEGVELGAAYLTLTPGYAGKVQPSQLNRARALERNHAFGEGGLRIMVQGQLPGNLITRLSGLSVVNALVGDSDKTWNVRIRRRDVGAEDATSNVATQPAALLWIAEREDGSLLAALPNDEKLYGRLKSALEGEARWRAVKELNSQDANSPIKIKIDIRRVQINKAKLDPDGKITGPDAIIPGSEQKITPGPDGHINLRAGEYVQIGFLNTGRADAYTTVLDLANNGSVQLAFPPLRDPNNVIRAGGDWTWTYRAVVRLTNPTSNIEEFRAIATSEYIDLSPLVTPDGARGTPVPKGKPLSPLADLLRNATLGLKGENAAANPKYWYTDTTSFFVGN